MQLAVDENYKISRTSLVALFAEIITALQIVTDLCNCYHVTVLAASELSATQYLHRILQNYLK